jgi:hypothetical protein
VHLDRAIGIAFEEKKDMFIKRYEIKKACSDYKKYSEEDSYNIFSNKTFGLRLGSVVNKVSKTKNKTHYMYFMIKDSVENKYRNIDVEIDLDDISCYDH